jgi:hypothetical protein
VTKRPLLAIAALLGACAAHPPARWAEGGAPVDLPHARWVRADATVELLPSGRVQVNADHVFTIDRAGRVFDPDAQPLALLEPDGRLMGPDDAPLGFVGSQSASLPGADTAWLTLMPGGEVIAYDDHGQPASLGRWIGQCEATPQTRQACVLVSHLLGGRLQGRSRVGFGFGLGVGIGIGGRVR